MNFAAKFGVGLVAVVLVSGITLAPAAFAQIGTTPSGMSAGNQSQESVNSMQNQLHYLTDVQRQQAIDPVEVAAYKTFYHASVAEPDNKIKLGNAFCRKYPRSPFTEAVDAGLTNAYFVKEDWKDFYAYADKTLALNPDEVDVLTVVGWVIPHQYDPRSPDAAKQLDEAEGYEKHALDVLDKLPKPKGVSDQQFAAMKGQKEQQAHSALGLVYFRRGDYAGSAKELQQSTQATSSPDPTDLYVLGTDLQKLDREADAEAAFKRCSQIAGPLQAPCQQNAAGEKK
jgi:tetratricopeptide (TPR) repeat protein